MKRIKPGKKRLFEEGCKGVKLEEISSEQREWESKKNKRDEGLRKKMKTELLERLKKRKKDDIF